MVYLLNSCSWLFIVCINFPVLYISALSFLTPPMNMGYSVGCVVTGRKLFSQGNYIRDIDDAEFDQMHKYKTDLADFQKQIEQAFANVDLPRPINSTLPPVPTRPSIPKFCTKPDTTLYIFSGCTVQNNKVYVGRGYARDLNEHEQEQLLVFAKQMLSHSKNATRSDSPTISPKSLDFCTEF